MDIFFFLNRRLRFIESLYKESTATFVETKRKIEAQEEPFIDHSDPADFDGTPSFFEEWQHADDCIVSLGRWSVLQLSAAVKAYLQEYVSDMSNYYGHHYPEFGAHQKTLEKCRGSWLQKYKCLFLDLFQIDWEKGPDLVRGIEHLVLTRNDIEHKSSLVTRYVRQDPQHREKHLNGFFVGEEEFLWDRSSALLVIENDRLQAAIDHVEKFCAWLETIRVHYLRFRRYPNYDEFLAIGTKSEEAEDSVS